MNKIIVCISGGNTFINCEDTVVNLVKRAPLPDSSSEEIRCNSPVCPQPTRIIGRRILTADMENLNDVINIESAISTFSSHNLKCSLKVVNGSTTPNYTFSDEFRDALTGQITGTYIYYFMLIVSLLNC